MPSSFEASPGVVPGASWAHPTHPYLRYPAGKFPARIHGDGDPPQLDLPLSETSMTMVWTLALVLVVLWALGLVSGYTLGGLLHVLIVIAVIVLVFQLLSGRRVV